MHKVTLVSMLCLAWRRKLISATLAQPIHTLQTSHRQLPEHDDLKYNDVIEVRYPCTTLTENAIPCRGIHPMHPSSCHNKRKSQSQTTKSYIIPIQTPLKGSTAWPRLLVIVGRVLQIAAVVEAKGRLKGHLFDAPFVPDVAGLRR